MMIHNNRYVLLLLFVLLAGGLLAVWSGCARGGVSSLLENESGEQLVSTDTSGYGEKQSTQQTNHSSEPFEEEVMLILHDEGDTQTHMLPQEQAQVITDLFYNHPKKIIDTPVESVGTVQFQIGQDTLSTSMGTLETLSGNVQGELVLIHLSEREYEQVHQIVSQYAQDIL